MISAMEKILKLRCEVNCRIEHGAESGGHLEYVKNALDEIVADSEKQDDWEKFHQIGR